MSATPRATPAARPPSIEPPPTAAAPTITGAAPAVAAATAPADSTEPAASPSPARTSPPSSSASSPASLPGGFDRAPLPAGPTTGSLPAVPAPRGLARVFAMPDLHGPRIRVGVLWGVVLAGAFWAGLPWLGALYGLIAAIAALQAGREWRKVGSQPNRLVAALGAGGMPVAAIWGVGLTGAVAIAVVVLALVAALLRRRRRKPFLSSAGMTVRISVFVGLAAASPVLMYRTSIVGALLLIGFVTAFDVGNFMVGAEAATPLPGIFAGLIVVGVGAFAISVLVSVFELEPFADAQHPWIFGGVVGLCAPFGEVAASLTLPAASAEAPALRRLDSLMVAGPAFLVLFWSYLGVA